MVSSTMKKIKKYVGRIFRESKGELDRYIRVIGIDPLTLDNAIKPVFVCRNYNPQTKQCNGETFTFFWKDLEHLFSQWDMEIANGDL